MWRDFEVGSPGKGDQAGMVTIEGTNPGPERGRIANANADATSRGLQITESSSVSPQYPVKGIPRPEASFHTLP